jgi:hypothetical protein
MIFERRATVVRLPGGKERHPNNRRPVTAISFPFET